MFLSVCPGRWTIQETKPLLNYTGKQKFVPTRWHLEKTDPYYSPLGYAYIDLAKLKRNPNDDSEIYFYMYCPPVNMQESDEVFFDRKRYQKKGNKGLAPPPKDRIWYFPDRATKAIQNMYAEADKYFNIKPSSLKRTDTQKQKSRKKHKNRR